MFRKTWAMRYHVIVTAHKKLRHDRHIAIQPALYASYGCNVTPSRLVFLFRVHAIALPVTVLVERKPVLLMPLLDDIFASAHTSCATFWVACQCNLQTTQPLLRECDIDTSAGAFIS